MPSYQSILLQNATLLVPKGPGDDHVIPLKNHSLLIEGNKIARIAPHIYPPSESTEVIDCSAKIISPGFVDTHHHVWQTQLKGRHADHSLLEYMVPGNMASHSYKPEDVFWGQLGGCLEALEAGTTTIVDHAHISYTPEHNNAALSATISSGIRSIYCYCPTGRVKTWKPFEMEEQLLPSWLFEQLTSLCKNGPFSNGRVTMGFAFDSFYLPKDVVVNIFNQVRGLGIKTITSHYVPSLLPGSTVDLLESYGLLEKDILLSHATPLNDSDAQKLQRVGASISSTPDTELQMGHGWPVCFQESAKSISSLGIDCHSNNTGSIVAQMKVGLQAERARRNGRIHEAGKIPAKVQVFTQDAFQLGTIGGARAIKMGDQIGSLEEGKIADLVIWDTLSPAMICAAEEDPIGAIILHSAPSDIDAVIIDGQFRKRNGQLVATKLELELMPNMKHEKSEVQWRDVAIELLKSRQNILEAEKASGADDREAGFENIVRIFGTDKDKLVY
ncbi:related to cytosine deaminase and related metal-dependent hydrolases [Fusarium mangiferae]|uniref:Related to cytosine deaminase and related metal-dependent hydrolases n=1 Tax=Fusarium mangiferae TaxID=192010 RepID=A0A1L7SU35_FUSMA|nr:related to cytosine deaminase and related metal-dependent hydrolases [Fusarium mangiferae]CVK85967.1 related to cytosine deaminase and related metal-dependent hydrolases [Fusarium mangiferae]